MSSIYHLFSTASKEKLGRASENEATQWGSKVDHTSKGMTSLAIDSIASYGWNCTIIARCSWPVRTGLWGACQGARKWRMAVVYAINESEIDRCRGTRSRRWARRGWRMTMASDSTNSMGSSGMFHVYIVLFTFLAQFWLFAVILVHTTFACLLLCGILHFKFLFN